MSNFWIKISANALANGNYDVSQGGELVRQTTQADRNLFGLTDTAVKNAIGALWSRNPNDIYFNDPTSWSDQTFARYGWAPLQLILSPVSASVKSFSIQKSEVDEKRVENTYSRPVQVAGSFQSEVENSAEVNWSQTNTLEVSQEIGFDFKFFGSKTTVSDSQSWQQGGSKTDTISIGSDVAVDFTLDPNDYAILTNVANIGTATIEITYEASLSGGIFCNYDPAYEIPNFGSSHHFYYMDISSVLAQMNVQNSMKSVATIDMTGFAYATTTIDGPFPISSSGEAKEAAGPRVLMCDLTSARAGDRVGIDERLELIDQKTYRVKQSAA